MKYIIVYNIYQMNEVLQNKITDKLILNFRRLKFRIDW